MSNYDTVEPDDYPVRLVPATDFTVEKLTWAYNQARVDYIVPMPMNPKRLQGYIDNYDVVLERSVVAMHGEQILGLSMLGARSHPPHTWITRLGVLPVKRRHGAGQKMMEYMIDQSKKIGAAYVILEVIKNNVPAHHLFIKLGFEEVRQLLILRRPPGPPAKDVDVPPYEVELLDMEHAIDLLHRRRSVPSWLDEVPSLINAGNLEALRVKLQNGARGWIVYQNTTFQLARLVPQTEAGDPRLVARALAHALHSRYDAKDTKTENVPLNDPHLPGLKDVGYIESFRRIEMKLDLTK